jgi:hypothetical protein
VNFQGHQPGSKESTFISLRNPWAEQPDLQMVIYTPLTQEDTAAKLRALMTGENQYDKVIS